MGTPPMKFAYVFQTVIPTFGYVWKTFRGSLSAVSTPNFASNSTPLKALDEIYKIYTYASFGEKNTLLHLWNLIEKP